jgi:hypothetical protein
MDDEVFCLFVILSCILTLAMPAAAQALFAVLSAALAVAALVSPRPTDDTRHSAERRRPVDQ